MDFENALLTHGPDPILSKILQQFILSLRPQTRNLSVDQISTTVTSVLADAFRSSERTVFWDDDIKANVDPFAGLEGGIFAADWDLKLKVLRQLVELQLTHSTEIKNTIDRAWGVMHNKHKKRDPETAPPDAGTAKSQDSLQLVPLGQDSQRKRYWIADDSPRIYISTNPWKITATFQTVASTRDEYIATIEMLKTNSPPPEQRKLSKLEIAHQALIKTLEARIEIIDAELARVQKVRRKIEQRQILMAQSEIRETRTRRQTRRPDYVYNDIDSDQDDADEYQFEEENDHDDDQFGEDDFNLRDGSNGRRSTGRVHRRSSRSTKGKRPSPDLAVHEWRGERRSSRLGAVESNPPRKRARTEESTASSVSLGWASSSAAPAVSNGSSAKPKVNGAAAVKDTEIAMERVRGKKSSRYWFYAVEPVPGAAGAVPPNTVPPHNVDYQQNGHASSSAVPSGDGSAMDIDRSMEGSLSPAPSIES
ncbi:hypothetical protein BJ138DRAFT_1158667 [Hygrophoropsis aurantiaca]|uniref:Uncharacterized protein n=1 Tax=Hygrophoropsis aurantiaca TaxID=72124 RepID=A0ACB8A4Q7_9AGAM|nr:hypothetical protein BJ138DRAFT_1158667 [Hygrophoropsis aurantiaca]